MVLLRAKKCTRQPPDGGRAQPSPHFVGIFHHGTSVAIYQKHKKAISIRKALPEGTDLRGPQTTEQDVALPLQPLLSARIIRLNCADH
jgi:hypothetical protein